MLLLKKLWEWKVLAIVFFLGFSHALTFAQQGIPYLTNYSLPNGLSTQNWGFQQAQNGVMYVLNRKGVYSFDGTSWENLNIAGRPIAMAYSNYLFYSSNRGVGYVVETSEGEFEQRELMKASDSNIFYKFSPLPNGLLVISPSAICRITTSPDVFLDTLYVEKRKQVFISDFFELNGKFYNVNNRAFVCLNNLEGGYEILTGLPIGVDMMYSFIHGSYAYFGASNNKLYRFDGEDLSAFTFDDEDYITASIPTGGVSIDENHFAVSTLNGGCVVVNAENGETAYTLNYLHGLPDDEVYSLGTDSFGGLWLAHGMGITRADLGLPLKSYSHFNGLMGNLLSAVVHNDKLYVGTSEGLFVLNEKRDYRAISVKVKPAKKQVKPEEEPAPKPAETVEEKKRGFLYRIFNRRSKKSDETELPSESKPQVAETSNKPAPKEQKRTIYQLQSISHEYDKVNGVVGKVKQLVEKDGLLYAATNLGVFQVSGKSATRILRDVNVSYLGLLKDPGQGFVVGAEGGAYLLKRVGRSWKLAELAKNENHLVVSVAQVGSDSYLMSNEFDVLLAQPQGASNYEVETIPFPDSHHNNPVVRLVNNVPYVFCSNGTYVFNRETKELVNDTISAIERYDAIDFSQPGYTFVKKGGEWQYASNRSNNKFSVLSYLNLLDNPNYIYTQSDSSLLVINGFSQVYKISSPPDTLQPDSLGIFIKRVFDKDGQMLAAESVELTYAMNSVKVRISSPQYLKENSVKYQYKIVGLTDQWSEWTLNPSLEFPFLPPGNHIIQIRSSDVLGQLSKILEIPVFIKPPFWQTLWFYLVCGAIVLFAFYSILKIRERSLKREKEILEQKVRERTKTIEEQKDILRKQRDDLEIYNKEILQQKEEIEAQRDEIETQRDQIFKQNEEITQSIAYARRIQSAVMPSNDVIDSVLPSYFIMLRPRDIVSGDFYWIGKKDDFTIVVAADCTGHGVPGAFVSMMGVSFLNDIVNVDGITEPHKMLEILRSKIITTLWQTGKEGEARDGMDVSVCVYSNNMRKVMFAGAYNPLYIVRKGELIEFKGDKMPVGTHPKQDIPFTCHTIDLLPGDNLYTFSDGFVDQFGGPNGRKFMAKPFKKLLSSLSDLTPEMQKQTLEDTLDKWQSHYDQVDDVLVIGVHVL